MLISNLLANNVSIEKLRLFIRFIYYALTSSCHKCNFNDLSKILNYLQLLKVVSNTLNVIHYNPHQESVNFFSLIYIPEYT